VWILARYCAAAHATGSIAELELAMLYDMNIGQAVLVGVIYQI